MTFTRRLIHIYIFFFFLLNIASPLLAQRLNIRVYNVPDGLVQSQVQTILQDFQGYLWIGTVDGLSRFDGHSFKNFTTEEGLPDNFIASGLVDRQGYLWFGFNNLQVGRFDPAISQLDTLLVLSDSAESSGIAVKSIYQDHTGAFWFATYGLGVFRWDGNHFNHYTTRNGLPGDRVFQIQEDKFGRLWFATNRGLLVCKATSPFQPEDCDTITTRDGLPDLRIFTVVMDSSGNIWCGTKEGISLIVPDKTHPVSQPIRTFTPKDGLPFSIVFNLYVDSRGIIWIGSYKQGVCVLHPQTLKRKELVFPRITSRNGLSRDNVTTIFQDREGNYWFGTDGGGICMFRDRHLELYTEAEGLPDNFVWSFAQDRNGNIWIGTEKGIAILNQKTTDAPVNQSIKILNSIGNIPIVDVFGMIRDYRGRIWFSSLGNGVIMIDPQTQKHRIFHNQKSIPWEEVANIAEDSTHHLWLGTMSKGIIRYDLETGQVEHLTRKDGLPGNAISKIFCTRNGRIWIATEQNGLVYYDGQHFQGYHSPDYPEPINAISIDEDHDGNLWIATMNGKLLRISSETVHDFSQIPALHNKHPYSVLVGPKNRIWMGSVQGILMFSPSDSSVKRLGNKEGFPISEANQDACMLDRDGNLWFGTIGGAIKYNPSRIAVNKTPPLIHLTKVRLFWNEIPLKSHAKFAWNKNYLTFYFTGISLANPGGVRYTYMLEGFDQGWSPPTSEDHATYSNLPPGSYTFKVKARNSDGVWSTRAATYSFRIQTPYWKQWWFILLSILTVALGFISIHHLRIARIARQREELKKRIEESTREIVLQKEKLEKAYDALLESETKFRIFTETTSSAIVIIQNGKFKYANPASEKLTEYSLAEFLNLKIEELVHPEDFHIIEEVEENSRKKPQEWHHMEIRIITKSGKERYISATARSITYEGETALLVTAFDLTERRKMEENLQQLTRAVETTPVAMVLTDLNGNITYVNQGFLIYCCMHCERDHLHKNIADFLDEKGKQILEKEIFPYLMEKQEWKGEIVIIPQKGDPFHAEMVCSVVTDAQKSPKQFLFHFLSIEERKQDEQFLKESMESYRELFNSIPEAIYVQDRDGRFLDVNEGAVKMYGYPKSFFIGKTPAVLAAPGMVDLEKTIKLLEEAFKGKPQKFEWWGMRKNGEIFPKEVILTRSHYFGKEVALAIARDITERKKYEEMIQEEKERLAVTLRSIGDAVVTTDTEGKIVLMNPVAEKLTGWFQEEAIGKPFEQVFQFASPTGTTENPVKKVMEAGQVIRLSEEALLISREGTERIVAHNGAPIRDKESNIIGVVLVLRDITERKQLEQERLKAQKLESIGILAGGIAHDFNNILTAVLGNISLARLLTRNNPKVHKRLEEAEKATIRAKDLTQQLLTFSKGGAPVKETTSIDDIIRDSVSFTLSGSAISCELELPENLWNVEVDTGQISQVIQNLIINAQQAMPNGGTIQVKAENMEINRKSGIPLPPGKYVKIMVKDQGVGIPEEHLDKIFDPYFTTKKQGNGLGLATAYSIVKRHNGLITVESAPGKGSTFYIYLPAARDQKATRKKKEQSVYKGTGRILIMDDEEMVQEVASEILTELGYEVDVASDGVEALEKYRQAKEEGKAFDVVIMDLTIPGGMGGKVAIQEFKKYDPEVKAIVASGYSSDPIISQYAEYGFSGCVRKPFTVKELSEVLKRLLGGKTSE